MILDAERFEPVADRVDRLRLDLIAMSSNLHCHGAVASSIATELVAKALAPLVPILRELDIVYLNAWQAWGKKARVGSDDAAGIRLADERFLGVWRNLL